MGHPNDPGLPRARRSLGQHFLIDPNLQRKIVAAIEPQPGDHVLEVGPGTGALTRHLVDRVEKLVLVELDERLADELRHEHGGCPGVEVIQGDILGLPIDRIARSAPLKVIGNIPYGITSPLIFHLLGGRRRPTRIVLTIQREVAERLAAEPGTKAYGALTVGVQAIARVETLFRISRHAFRPRPDVESMVVRIEPIEPSPLTEGEEEALRRLTRNAFSRRRKQLQNVLRQSPEYSLSGSEVDQLLGSLGIDAAVRPDALAVAEYVRLAGALAARPRG